MAANEVAIPTGGADRKDGEVSQRRVPTLRRRDVQGMRAVAVLLVVVFHAGLPLRGGFVGVDVFFVISGYVITGMLVREREATGRISLRRFYGRRVRRLVPAAALMSTTTLCFSIIGMSPIGTSQGAIGKAAMAATGFSANAYFFFATGGYFQPDAALNPFLHTWSLSVEEQFYLFFPAFLMCCYWLRARSQGRRLILASFVACGSVSLAANLVFSHTLLSRVTHLSSIAPPDVTLRFAFFATPLRAWEFVGGAVIFLLPDLRSGWTKRPAVALGMVTVLASAAVIEESWTFPGAFALAPVLGTMMMLLGGRDAGGSVTRLLSSRSFVWLGDRSYSWYLWHWPAIVFCRYWFPGDELLTLFAVVVSLLIASVAYAWVEHPIHTKRDLDSRRWLTAIGSMGFLVPLLVAGIVAVGSSNGWGSARLQALDADVAPSHADTLRSCASVSPLRVGGSPQCTWSVAQPKGTILLIGDSNAGHFTEPVISAARRLGYNLEVATSGGCPLLMHREYPTSNCREFVLGSLRAIRTMTDPYAAIIISNASVGYLQGPEAAFFVPTATAGPETSWAREMRSTVSQAGGRSPIIVVGAVPQFAGIPSCAAPNLWLARAKNCGELSSNSASYQVRKKLVAAERKALAGSATYLDTGGILCPGTGGCSAYLRGKLLYRDGAHLSVSGSLIFSQDFERHLRVVLTGRIPLAR
jgi:peptidoglycan/LPS O-acetylase OafA/YrhL